MRALVKHLSILEFHHGDCIGSDAEAHEIVGRWAPNAELHVHPPSNPVARARCQGNVTYREKGYLERDRDIVDATVLLIATPKTFHEVKRSGTWYTIRYARSQLRTIAIILPDGSLETENY